MPAKRRRKNERQGENGFLFLHVAPVIRKKQVKKINILPDSFQAFAIRWQEANGRANIMGRSMSVQGKAKECARVVLDHASGNILCDAGRRLYHMNYFGTAMRQHMEYIKAEKLIVPSSVIALVDRAEKVLRAECDGKDCSLEACAR